MTTNEIQDQQSGMHTVVRHLGATDDYAFQIGEFSASRLTRDQIEGIIGGDIMVILQSAVTPIPRGDGTGWDVCVADMEQGHVTIQMSNTEMDSLHAACHTALGTVIYTYDVNWQRDGF